MTTTDPRADGPPRFSVRQRLTAAVALLTAAALVAVGATLFVLESQRIDRVIDASLGQEVGELRRLQAEGVDPETGRPFTSPDRLIAFFLSRNVPDADENLWHFPVSGTPTFVGEGQRVLRTSPRFPALVERLTRRGGVADLDVGGRTFRVAVQPVQQGDERAAFVVTHDVDGSRAQLRELMVTYALLSALSVILISAVASWLAGRLLSPVRRLRETARGITEGDLGGRLEVTGNDDLTELQRTFNDMLDRLEEAFASQRRLLDDAAHELRTPLTVLQGHLEVLDPTDPDDVRTTRTLLLDEIDRMTRLVHDLLLLAKAERPDFVRLERTDVEALTLGALERARGLADRSWVLDAVARTHVDVDPQRLTQALLQLADNAVRHTRPGAEVGIGSRVLDGHVELWVRDTGAGVPSALRGTIFERFTQGDGEQAGFGLGLSIVAAIMEAHEGRVVLDPPGATSGATFRLVIPAGGLW
ncbi:two-component system OmpR family sensor kinase [Aeromicrobium sp. SORGH_AS981]|uniref:sensor histidine kinase n=1 Tax=Aeromicrobium sp. SORGH_AS_0981 TaxID=3041802 RepID=UPI002858CE5A|nr:HAMP domain-containing sensor histidine kinase [Aeromicrobium sp. SORGH_AS_0981]MDR6119786.1 two-component system OmpR family sensor kinase [Aeromicrobium sp. SORGH_AS_0981]